MKFENTLVSNFEGAFRGMRNPLESWGRSDSYFGLTNMTDEIITDIAIRWAEADNTATDFDDAVNYYKRELESNGILKSDGSVSDVALIGPEDMKLAKKLIKAGDASHRKFLRQIFVSVDIAAPLYW